MLFNALLTYVAEQGWLDRDFIAASTRASRRPCRPTAPAWRRRPGHRPQQEDIVKAAHWIAEPKEGGKRRRTMFGYEKGLIWGNDNYHANAALVNLALATGNVGAPAAAACASAGTRRAMSGLRTRTSAGLRPTSTGS